jgi:uncharacterized membrane protein
VFDTIFGLPAHPLMVHAPVVLIPLAVAAALVYALVPPLRQRVGWVLVLLSLAGAGGAFAAVESGQRFALTKPSSTQLNTHGNFGLQVRDFAVLLAVVAVVLVGVDMSRRGRSTFRPSGDSDGYTYQRPRSGGVVMTVVSLVLSIGLLAVAGAAMFYVVRTGDSGARMVWSTGTPR